MNNKLRNINCLVVLSVLFLALNSTSCKKFLQVEAPATSVNEENVYKSDATAIAVLTEIYAKLAGGTEGGFTGANSITLLTGLSADELTLASSVTDERLIAYYHNQLRTSRDINYGIDYWRGTGFNNLFICNAAIEGLTASISLTESVKTQLLGEAKFLRALFNFYLVNLYSDVPLPLTTDPNENRLLPRSSVQQVYEQIVLDLKDAQSLLSSSFLDASLLTSSNERVRPTKWSATALLARTYLYVGKYAEAEAEASSIIAHSAQFSLAPINAVFLKNSTEAIWQLQPVQLNRNTEDAFTFIFPPSGPNRNNNPVYLSPQLLNAFEASDARRLPGGWVDSVIAGGITYFFPAKYRATVATSAATEYQMMFRLPEQYLIRAEARAQLNNIQAAKDDLNVIRTRAALPETNANDKISLLTAILKERQVELFTELGQRWLDLKRTGNIDEVMATVTPLKANGAQWQSYQQLYPIIFSDIEKNPNLTQNPGY